MNGYYATTMDQPESRYLKAIHLWEFAGFQIGDEVVVDEGSDRERHGQIVDVIVDERPKAFIVLTGSLAPLMDGQGRSHTLLEDVDVEHRPLRHTRLAKHYGDPSSRASVESNI
jgi:hypothetical protein